MHQLPASSARLLRVGVLSAGLAILTATQAAAAPALTTTTSPSLARAGTQVALSVSSSTALAAPPSVTVSGACLDTTTATMTLDSTAQTATGSYTVPAGTGDCVAAVSASATDSSGATSTGGDAKFTVDRTSPAVVESISGTPGPSGWYTAPVGVSVSGTDATSGVAAVYVGSTPDCAPTAPQACTLYTGPNPFNMLVTIDGSYTIYGFVEDGAGNTSPQQQGTVRLDQTPPTVSASLTGTLGSSNWYTSPVTVTLAATDAVSGVASVRYSVDGGPWQTGSSVTVSGDGTHQVQYSAADVAGNASAVQTTSFSVDATAPSINVSSTGRLGTNAWYTGPVSVSMSAVDATSGVSGLSYTLDGVGPMAVPAAGGSLTISADGTHALQVTATDVAGNTSSRTLGYAIDSAAPTVPANLTAKSGASSGSVSLAWSAATDSTSGVAGYQVYTARRSSTGCPSGLTGYTTSSVSGTSNMVTGLVGGAYYCFAVAAVDGAGNVGTASSSVVARAAR